MVLKSLAKGYAIVFAFMHVAAIPLGVRIEGVSYTLSVLLILLFACLCIAGFLWDNKYWRLFLTAGWSVSVMVEWTHFIIWAPAWSDLQYIVMALLNMVMALSLAYLACENLVKK